MSGLVRTCWQYLRRGAVLVLALASAASAQAVTRWNAADEVRLARGEAVVRVVEQSGPGGRVVAAIDIPAPASLVWRVMLDCERAPRYVPGLRSCAVIEVDDDGLGDVREHSIRWLAFLPDLRLRFRSHYEPERTIQVTRIGGDLAAMDGAWVLEPREGGRMTRLHYDFRLAPRTPVPSGLIRAGMMRDAPKVLDAVRTEVLRVARQ